MSSSSDREWQIQITALVAEVKSNQENLHDKLDTFITASSKRTDDLEHVVYGNGSEGLTETVRNMKGKWAVAYGLIIIALSSVASAAAKEAFSYMFK